VTSSGPHARRRGSLEAKELKWHVVVDALEQCEKFGWQGVAEVFERNDKLLEVSRALKAERDQALLENARLKRQANGVGNALAQQLWQSAGMSITIGNRHAQWLLDLHAQGRLHLTAKEADFVQSCARRARLSERQQAWLKDITEHAIARTGETPLP